ncbi:MAG: polysaccharide biosynthesis tyrosine autokinase [Elusimicrobia bacterium]|nr:polysaccharide biosynthesis tyrosine autokinase [Elusimicrobiota bacterium]
MTANPDFSSSDELDLTHYIDVILRRRWIVAAAAVIVLTTTALVTFTMRPVYQASTMLEIEKERGGGATVQTGTMIENSDEDYYQTQYKLLQSESLLRQVYGELDLSKTEDFKSGLPSLRGAVKIAPVLRSRLVYVLVDSHDPRLAANISNRIAQDFTQQNLTNQLFISKEVLDTLQSKGDRSAYDALPAVVNSPLIQQLKAQYAKLQAQYADMSARFTPKYPAMIALHANMAALDAQINSETDNIVQSMKTELSGQLRGNNVRIIDPADVPRWPYRPKKLLNLILGLFGGLALGIALAFLVETIDQSVRTQEDVENRLGLPFLGVIPQAVIKDDHILAPMLAKELSLTSEAFRNLRTMVDFAGVDGKAKALLLTSTVQGEGKTYAASNLAVALSQLGESVLLIDGDLRRPQVHRTFGVTKEKGLADFLSQGRDASELKELLQATEVPGLKVLPCGPRPPNPSELLNTPRLQALVAWARENFDRVVVDCTPMFPINDTLLWGRHVRSAVFVTRYGKTRIPLILDAAKKLSTGGVKVLGVAVNSATPGGLSYASYGYYYQQYYHSYHETVSATPAR